MLILFSLSVYLMVGMLCCWWGWSSLDAVDRRDFWIAASLGRYSPLILGLTLVVVAAMWPVCLGLAVRAKWREWRFRRRLRQMEGIFAELRREIESRGGR